MTPAIAARIPLVRRPKAPGLPLAERIDHLTALALPPADAGHRALVARASGVLNYAALIASDVGLPDLAADLCWKQHRAFADAGRLTGNIAVMALMPMVNLARRLIREGDGQAAYEILERLLHAGRRRGTTEIRDREIDLSVLTGTAADHRRICEELWATVLIDGARALARIGRWTEAAETMAAHRGVGNRMLDGRQITIMSLMERGLDRQARAMIDTSVPTEPWEDTVAALLRAHCRPPRPHPDLALCEVLPVITPPRPGHRRVPGPSRTDRARPEPRTREPANLTGIRVKDALADVAALDAYAARDVLSHHPARSRLTPGQTRKLRAVLTASGLDAGHLCAAHAQALTAAVDKAEIALRRQL
ncbi:hypothetical protein [Embleya sp. NPDC059237]|uniref:hypothetical protein n=1 Tax=Embleya sp. NPDC059237 TaxID=3346784 RepID=UPI00367C59C9